nr:uncharacterized protein LOC112543921 [Pelodiscus sinensis]|eukprot:XP_025034922.1 uncharacterized protein LOC112543921 [Pelodiscus sinensis]
MGELPPLQVQLLVAAAYAPRRGSFLPLAMTGEGLELGAQLALKGAVLELLVSHPGGIPLRNFGGLFYQHHSRRLDLARHGYLSLRHLLGDMKELVTLDEEGEETKARCRHLACNPLLEAKRPKRRHRPRRSRKEVPPEGQPSEAANTGGVAGCRGLPLVWGDRRLLPGGDGKCMDRTAGAGYTTRRNSDLSGLICIRTPWAFPWLWEQRGGV